MQKVAEPSQGMQTLLLEPMLSIRETHLDLVSNQSSSDINLINEFSISSPFHLSIRQADLQTNTSRLGRVNMVVV